jgi:hypothetical protein
MTHFFQFAMVLVIPGALLITLAALLVVAKAAMTSALIWAHCHHPATPDENSWRPLCCHKNKPRPVHVAGAYRLMPQFVGPCDPGGVGSGDGDAARIGLYFFHTPCRATAK